MSQQLHTVVIEMDPRTLVASEEHQADLIREFQLIALSTSRAPGEQPPLPGRLADLVVEVLRDYQGVQEENLAKAHAAIERGETVVRLEMLLPAAVVGAVEKILGALEEADAFCRDGVALLTLATPPDVAAARRWFVAEIRRQIERAVSG
ncbi:MAG TPA: hypothetical protein VF230_07795 [Acidimicrobiales bacterium]